MIDRLIEMYRSDKWWKRAIDAAVGLSLTGVMTVLLYLPWYFFDVAPFESALLVLCAGILVVLLAFIGDLIMRVVVKAYDRIQDRKHADERQKAKDDYYANQQ